MISTPSGIGIPRVLVVEDEPMLLKSVVAGLSRLPGLEVVGAGTVAGAVAELQVRAPAIVISDIDLPDRSGIELLGELGARGLKPRVIFMSAYVKAYRAQIPPHAGVEVLEKPVTLEQLRGLVTQWVSQPAAASPFGVADYLQLASLGHHSVVLEVSGPAAGQIVVVQGEAWSAADGEGSGMDAFRRLAMAQGAMVTCQTLTTQPGERTLSGSCESLLLECARIADEAKARRPANDGFTELTLDDGLDDAPLELPPAAPAPAPVPAPALPPAPPAPPAPDFDALFEAGVEASLSKRYGDALQAFRAAEKLRPEDTKVKVNIARLEKLVAQQENA